MAQGAQDRGERLKRLLPLFLATLTISATANSGYAILAVMKDDFVNRRKWFTEDEMADYIAIIQSAPGAMAVNISMIVGYQSAGFLGSLAAVAGCILPPLVVMTAVTFFYEAIVSNQLVFLFMRGMQLGVVGMLLDIIIGLFTNITKGRGIAYPLALMALAFLYVQLTDWSILYLAVACAAAGIIRALAIARGEEGCWASCSRSCSPSCA